MNTQLIFSTPKVLLAALALASLCVRAQAQPADPRIGFVYPAGGRLGSSFQVKLGGQFLEGVTNAYVSGEGIQAVVVSHEKPLTPQQANALRERQKELQEKRGASRNRSGGGTKTVWTAADMRALEEIRIKLAGFQRRPANPAIAETVTLQVTVAANARPGRRELRVRTPQGLSNPLAFCLGQLPEICERQTDSPDQVGRPFRNPGEGQAVPPSEMRITIPATVNGQVYQGGVDRYRFQARKGQKLVITASARELIPYIPDAVPGWFQATLALRDSAGKELAYADDYRFHPDPVLLYEVTRDGEYVVEIKDAIYRGRADFVYRVSIAESPFVTSLFPLGGPAGTETTLNLIGWNLPSPTLVHRAGTNAGIWTVSVESDKWRSNPLSFAVNTLPEQLEQEPNNTADSAQAVTLPAVINGRIHKANDGDTFRIEGRAGQSFVAEVHARRLDTPLDSVLKITDGTGRQVAFNDDYEDKGDGLNTHHADSYLRITLPASGTYFVHLGDAQQHGGEEYAYRLRLSAPQPDFELRIVPSSINIRAGVNVPLTVYALRKDGFTNEITLELEDAPAGFGLSGARIPAGADQVRLTMSAGPQPRPVNISMVGHAFIEGKRVSRRAVPAEDMMQAFAYRHLVPAEELKVTVAGRFAGRGGGMRLVSPLPLRIPVGGSARVKLTAPAFALTERFGLELSEPPEGISLERVAAADMGSEIVFQADAAKARLGTKGNLIVNVTVGGTPAAKAKKQAPARRAAVGVLPAIPFEIVARDQGSGASAR